MSHKENQASQRAIRSPHPPGKNGLVSPPSFLSCSSCPSWLPSLGQRKMNHKEHKEHEEQVARRLGDQTLVARPAWELSRAQLDQVPAEVRQSIDELIRPIDQQSVLHAGDLVERAIGNASAHLLWLEIIEQYRLKRQFLEYGTQRGLEIARQLRLLNIKLALGRLLLRLRPSALLVHSADEEEGHPHELVGADAGAGRDEAEVGDGGEG